MTAYGAINLGLAAVMAVMLMASHVGTSVSFRRKLFAGRALLCTSVVAITSVALLGPHFGLTWSLGGTGSALAASNALDWFTVACAVCGSIAALKTLHAVREYRRLASILRSALVVRRHGHVMVVASDRVDVPCSVRTLRSRWVVLPAHILGSRDDVRFAVSHELQHHRHGDTSWAWCVHALTILCWPNPVVHLWRRWHARVQELACDEALLTRPEFRVADYARCLLNVAERALTERHVLAPPMANGSQLAKRIEMLFASPERRAAKSLIAAACAFALVLGVCISGFAAGWTSRPAEVLPVDESFVADVDHGEVPCEDSLTAMECR